MVTPDELDDPDDLALGCSIDGETVQDARTSDLVFGVPQLIAELSAVVPLLPGDIIFTGTPAGVGVSRKPPRFLQPGETLTSWIEGIGTIRTRFTAPVRRSRCWVTCSSGTSASRYRMSRRSAPSWPTSWAWCRGDDPNTLAQRRQGTAGRRGRGPVGGRHLPGLRGRRAPTPGPRPWPG